ncbi:MAG: hypothetical protein HYZ42_06380, partial [Bacteroidetes bacterium]|nr:hypothetical protein [Bacteroidota bacterium]
MKKVILIAILFSSVLNLKAQKIVGGGLSYKMALIVTNDFAGFAKQTSLHGFYQLNNLSLTGDREIYLGA